MSTNGIIARSTGEGTFEGRYHRWDSYPHGLGVALVELYRGHFKHDLSRMLQVLLDKTSRRLEHDCPHGLQTEARLHECDATPRRHVY